VADGAAQMRAFTAVAVFRLAKQALEAWLQFLHKERFCIVTRCGNFLQL